MPTTSVLLVWSRSAHSLNMAASSGASRISKRSVFLLLVGLPFGDISSPHFCPYRNNNIRPYKMSSIIFLVETAAQSLGGCLLRLSNDGVSVFIAFFSGGIGDNKITADHGSIGIFRIHPACDHVLAVSQMGHGGVRKFAEGGGGRGFQIALNDQRRAIKGVIVGMAGGICG